MKTKTYLLFFHALMVSYLMLCFFACAEDTSEEDSLWYADVEMSNQPIDRPSETINGHEAVDLGLSVKWATCNVGADSPAYYGDYFAWGETSPKSTYAWSTYKWCNGSSRTLTKYCTDSDYGTVDNKTQLDLADDAAHVNWGSGWRMPTYEEWEELFTECTRNSTALNGVHVYKMVSKKNGTCIFLPAAGYRGGGSLSWDCYYWSSSLYTSSPDIAWYMRLGLRYDERCYGLSVRPVCE